MAIAMVSAFTRSRQGFHGTTRLDGLKAAAIFRWPGPIHEGKGECVQVLDRRATEEQRTALFRILRGEDTEPGATVFQVFASTCDTVHEPIVADYRSSSSTSTAARQGPRSTA